MTLSQSPLWHELKHHFPYSVAATAAGIMMAGLMLYMAIIVAGPDMAPGTPHEAETATLSETAPAAEAGSGHDHHEVTLTAAGAAVMSRAAWSVFHIFHPMHLLFSAVATTAMFWRYERRLVKAILVGLIGPLTVCGISDVFIPYFGGLLLGVKGIEFHWCLLSHPMLVIPPAMIGVVVGLLAAETVKACTYYSHSAHVFVSSMAVLFYLISFGMTDWATRLGPVFVLLLIAVTIPCCLNDIGLPLVVIRKESALHPACPIDHHHEHAEDAAGHTH